MLQLLKTTKHYWPAFQKVWKRERLLLIFFTSLFSVSSAQTGIIKGKVKDGETVLEAATVSIGQQSNLTNSAGEFSITVKPGRYTLLITHAGYKKFEQPVVINAGENQFREFTMLRDDPLGEVVVLGSRSFIQRSNLNTTVPVDVITSKELKQTAQFSLIQMLNFTAPSYNVSRESLFEPVTLRGLGPDHLLILLNGTRYHNTAYVNNGSIKGTLGLGAVTNELSSIPFSAIEKIEILRDGASAQYGSDAIAGVMNIALKKTTGKTLINLQLGQQYKGDGENIVFGINHGITLNKKGFLNFSGDFRYRKPTHRGGEYQGTVYYNIPVNATPAVRDIIVALDNKKIEERGFNRKMPVSNDGSIQLSGLGFLINGGYPISNQVELFWTSSVNHRSAVYEGAYRFPKTIAQVNTELYPDGFKVKPVINSTDISMIAGVRGKTARGWNWEYSSVYGGNSNKQIGKNTNNASQYSLGANAPTEFYGGRPIFTQQINNLSFNKDLSNRIKGLTSFNIGLGAEYRLENYRTLGGEEASWKDYDSSGPRLGGAAGVASISPDDAVNEGRRVAGLYVDLETDVNEHLLINIAARYENYNDYGNNLAGKLAMRYKVSSVFSVRGSVSSGFHAPALQQIYLTSTGSVWKNIGGISFPVSTGIFRNNSDVATAFGVKQLRPEKATNISGGFTSTLSPHINITVDGYWIQIKNRIVLSGSFDRGNPSVNTILQNRPDIDLVQFVTNAINTKTRGIDMVMNGNWKIKKSGLQLTLAANFTHTNLFGPIQSTDKLPADTLNTNTLFNREEREKIEHGQPASKIIGSGNYRSGKMGILIRSTRFGKTSVVYSSDDKTRDEFFSPKILTDVSVNYTPKTGLTITAGANNIFDVYPDPIKNSINKNQGILIYSNQASPFGYNGGYYFLGMVFNF
jgi:iron complex outermembrane receptor protein